MKRMRKNRLKKAYCSLRSKLQGISALGTFNKTHILCNNIKDRQKTINSSKDDILSSFIIIKSDK